MLITATYFLPLISSISSLSAASSGREPSKTAIISSAELILSRAISIPADSTGSSVSRRPAVSARRSRIPATSADSSITSRVVPATSVTIERLQRKSKFITVDLPVFGLPAMTVCTPSRSILPQSAESISRCVCSAAEQSSSLSSLSSTSGTSSSGKSDHAASDEEALSSIALMLWAALKTAPLRAPTAARCACSPEAPIISMTDSAAVRSSLPFR